MPRVFAIGKSVFDILFRNNQPFTAKVGGSMLNTCVSLGRLGIDVYLIGEYGKDFAGNITHEFLLKNNVKTDFIYRFDNGQTTISLAFLDENNNAAYNFYRNMPENRLQMKMPEIRQDDIVLFGSFYIFEPEVEKKIRPFLRSAKEAGAVLMYDPNFRKPHYAQIDRLKPEFMEYIGMADIVRGSHEDFYGIFGVSSFDDLLPMFPNHDALLIYTAAQDGVYLSCQGNSGFYKVPPIKPVSTIGAGDTFNAGIIYSIIKNKLKRKDLQQLPDEISDRIINSAVSFASHVCLSEDNYLSEMFVKQQKMDS